MMSSFSRTFVTLVVLMFAAAVVFGQDDGWMRVQSDDGEFSVEVPRKHKFFFDERGFSVSDSGRNLSLTKMEMLNSIVDGTLVSVERYVASKDALTRIYESDRQHKGVTADTGEMRPAGTKFRQIVSKTDQFYSIRQYFYTKDHAYILTTASRGEETQGMRRFLDSVMVQMKPPTAKTDGTSFSQLVPSQIEVQDLTAQKPGPRPAVPGHLATSGPVYKPAVVVGKPLASFTEAARAARVTGTIAIRLQFAEDGFIPKLSFLRSLPGGLSRQTLLAAMRVKFLPAEKDGVPISTSKSVEYTFSIY